MPFWIAAAGLAGLIALTIALAFRRGGAAPASPAVAVYRGQLAELERELERGLLRPEEAARSRTEIARRILEADAAGRATSPLVTERRQAVAGTALAVAILAGAFVVYLRIGAPDLPDQPLDQRLAAADALRSARPGQVAMEAAAPAAPPAALPPEDAALIGQLRSALAARPDDLEGQGLLARSEAAVGAYAAAARAQAAVLRLKGEAASATDRAVLADLMIAAAGGRVSPEAEEVLMQSLRADPREPLALLQAGRLFEQTGRPDVTFRLWRDLIATGAEDPWMGAVMAEMPRLAALAGVDYAPPAPDMPAAGPAFPGPSAEDIAAAADLPEADRQAMIRGMVERLSARMAQQGGPPQDWARLVTALAVIGETERARAVWIEAQGVFAASPADLAPIRAAAIAAGLAG